MLCGYQSSILGRLFIYGSPSSFSDNDVHETDIIHRLHARSILAAEWLIEHCASELTQIVEITQTRPLNSTSDRKRSFLVNGPSVARGCFISITRTRDSRWSWTDDRKRVIGGNESIFYSDKRRDQILRFIYRDPLVGCGLFVISLPFPICPCLQ